MRFFLSFRIESAIKGERLRDSRAIFPFTSYATNSLCYLISHLLRTFLWPQPNIYLSSIFISLLSPQALLAPAWIWKNNAMQSFHKRQPCLKIGDKACIFFCAHRFHQCLLYIFFNPLRFHDTHPPKFGNHVCACWLRLWKGNVIISQNLWHHRVIFFNRRNLILESATAISSPEFRENVQRPTFGKRCEKVKVTHFTWASTAI